MNLQEFKDKLMRDMQADGIQFSKCCNCGTVYPLESEWQDQTVCGKRCFNEYLAYLNNPE